MARQVFEGLKAVGFVQAGVGPATLKVLNDHGATVVRIESIKRPDNLRVAFPFKDNKPGINRGGFFALANNDKLSMALDMKHPRSKEVTEKLVKWADVVVDNYAPGVMERWGLGYEEVKKMNPGVVMISLSQQGQTGPHSLLPGYGPQLQGLAGLVHLTGWPDRAPVLISRSYPDHIAPRFGQIALIAALDYRRRTGKGQYIDASEYEDCVHWLAPTILDCAVNGRVKNRTGNWCSNAAPHGAYPCKGEDRWCVIAVFTDQEWKAFCSVIGDPAWTKEGKFSTLLGRKKNEQELDRLISQWTIDHPPEEIMSRMQETGVPSGVVRNGEEVIEKCPQLKHRHYFWKLNHPEMGEVTNIGPSFMLSEAPATLRKAAPMLGEHTEFVCRELLRMSDEEFIELLNDKVFE
jgi:benzylsuccinate CoA-transferase BbsF subunit